MKTLLVLLAGIVTGGLLAAGGLYFNPAATETLSPLAASEKPQISLSYSAVPAEAIAYTNNGESRIAPMPDRIAALWEPPISNTDVLVTELFDVRGNRVGVGIKFSSWSEKTRLLSGDALVDSVWHVMLPGRGSLVMAQTENRWNFMRDIVLPAYWNAGNSWKGAWHGRLSSGPATLGMARVHGGSGALRDLEALAVELLSAKAYSTSVGPIAADGQLVIELPGAAEELNARAARP
jgi:hypothetical protein